MFFDNQLCTARMFVAHKAAIGEQQSCLSRMDERQRAQVLTSR